MLSIIMLTVTKPFVPSVVMLSVVMPNVIVQPGVLALKRGGSHEYTNL